MRLHILSTRTTDAELLPLQAQFRLALGKFRRFYLVHFRKRYVAEQLALRQGHCNRTGACCKLLFNCPLLEVGGENPSCTIHRFKPRPCSTFPIDERDLRDRDLISPHTRCGFYFPEQDS